MSRHIDAEKLWEEIESEDIYTDFQSACIFKMVREKINDAPTADVEEVRHGEWLENGANYKCSVCGNTESYYSDSYCRVCGARMDGGKE